jgi:hypothetical protein
MTRSLFLFAVIVLAVVCMPWAADAQDTLTVLATPAGNLNTVINGDTLAGGVRAHPNRVYRLRRGTVYQVTAPMNINGPITIIANDSAGIKPPVLAPAILIDNSSIGTYFNITGKGAKIFMRDLYMLAMRSDQAWLGWGCQAINVAADSVKLKLRNMVFDGFGECIHQSYWLKSDVQDCVFRNHMHTGSWFNGQPFMGGAPVALDTTLFFNNTFMATGAYHWNIRGYTPLARFEHNTLLYSIVNPFLIRQATNIKIKNNIFYAQHAMGGNPTHVYDGWFLNSPDTASSSMIRIRGNDSTSYWAHLWWDATNNKPSAFTGPEAFVDASHNVTAGMMDATKRVFEVDHNSWFLPTKLTDFYRAYNDTTTAYDSIGVPVYHAAANPKMRVKRILIPPTYLSNYAKWTIDSLAGKLSSGVKIDKNPITGDPGFAANVAAHIDSVIWYVNSISTNNITETRRWAFPNNRLYPPVWPLPENLAYTNTSMQSAGSDGLPLGDLNWFPAKKALWLTLTNVEMVDNTIPEGFSLSQNYPNPFNPTTTIEFSIPKASRVTLTIYNMLGQEVTTLVSGQLGAGHYSTPFDATKLASGTYIYRLTADNFVTASKMLLLK